MTASFHEIARQAGRRLAAAGIEDARREAWLLLATASGRSRVNLLGHADEVPDETVRARFEDMVVRRIAREPVAHILGEKEFWSLTLRVPPGVLVPRPDSETVVEAALAQSADRGAPLRVLDLGTGTGCLLLALLSELPRALGVGVDLDPRACRVALANARSLGLAGRTRIVRGSWADALRGPFDLIVSNPPYVPSGARAGLPPEVRDFEPDRALFAGTDGLGAYRRLAPELARLLAPHGRVCLEHGHDQAPGLRQIMAAGGLEVLETRHDLGGRARVTVLKKLS